MENIDKIQGDSTNIKFFSEDVDKIYYEYKEKIEEIIHENYGLNVGDEILDMFRNIGLEISGRNNNLLKLLEEKYNLNFLENLDFSGGLKIGKEELEKIDNEDIKTFFKSDYVREESGNYYSRGYGYYFNLDGFDNDGGINYILEPDLYFKNLKKYFDDIIKSLNYFKGKQISSIEDSEKEVFLILLEHYKNILYYFQNFLLLTNNKDHLAKHVGNLSTRNFDKYYGYENLELREEYIESLNTELEKVIVQFSDLLLNIDNKNEFSIGETLNSNVFDYGAEFFAKSFDLQKNIVSDLEDKKNNGKQTDIKGANKFILKMNNKFIGNLLRIIREEDNPIKQIFASYNIAKNIPNETSNIDINGMLYGGIEMPYFMKYVLTRFYNKEPDLLDINLISLSAYHNRNLKRVSNADEYPEKQKSEEKKLQLVLDDNLFYGSTLQVGGNNLMDRGPVLSGVTEVGLRRGKLGKISEGKSLNFLLSKINGSSSVTPIEKNAKGGSYKNLVNKYIKKKLPQLVGKF